MNNTFRALLEEATFTKEILISSISQISKANYANKGYYFQAFTSLSTGLERLGKLCLLLDFYIKNKGQFPDINYVKNQIRHDLLLLYEKSRQTITDFDIKFTYLDNLDNPLHQEILKILSGFAKGDRYSNIDLLVTKNRSSDPIFEWNTKVDTVLFADKVSNKEKEKIELNSKIVGDLTKSNFHINHYSEARENIATMQEGSYLTGVNHSVIKYRRLYILQIIRYWIEILSKLETLAMNLGKFEIPFLLEVFAVFYNNDKLFLTTKEFKER